MVFLLPETHGPTILAGLSEQLRMRGIPNAWAAHELEHHTTQEFIRLHIGRPICMLQGDLLSPNLYIDGMR